MRFTAKQYDEAIKNLTDAKLQLEPDGRNCVVCGDSGHQAFECGWNPLVAVEICCSIAKEARALHDKIHENRFEGTHEEKLHEILHWLAGHNTSMGEVCGPARIMKITASD